MLARLFDWAGWLEARLDVPDPDLGAISAAVAARNAREVARGIRRHGAERMDRAHLDDAALDGGPELDALVRGYELANPSHMAVGGIARWLKKRG